MRVFLKGFYMGKKKETKVKDKGCATEEVFSFNLVDNPWVWALNKEGRTSQYSLKDLFSNADSILDLSNENVYVNASIQSLLMCILYVAYSRNPGTKDMDQESFVYRDDIILGYLESCHNLFDLYDPQHPFMQVPEGFTFKSLYTKNLKNGKKGEVQLGAGEERLNQDSNLVIKKEDQLRSKSIPINSLNPFAASSSKAPMWSLKEECTDDWIARQLITFRLWHLKANAGSAASRPVQIESSLMLAHKFSLFFIKGDTLADTFHLNFKGKCLWKEMHPIWEQDLYEENAYINSHYIAYGDKVFYDAAVSQADIARILTYSNVYIHIDPKGKAYSVGYRLPIKLFTTKPDPNGKDRDIQEWSYIKGLLNIYDWNLDRCMYSVQREILSDPYNESLLKAKHIELIRHPAITDQLSAFVRLYTDPVSLIGNGLLRAEAHDEDELFELREIFYNLCGELENLAPRFKKPVDDIFNILYPLHGEKGSANKAIRNAKLKVYSSILKNNASQIESLFLEYINTMSSQLSNRGLLESEGRRLRNRAYTIYKQSFWDFIDRHCSNIYFNLDNKKDLGGIAMGRLESIKEISANTYACMKANFRDTAKLRDMRLGNYMPDLNIEGFNILSTNRKKKECMLEGITKALYVWANHQHDLGEGYAGAMKTPDCLKETYSYKESFGYVLYRLSLKCKKEEFEKKMRKYQRSLFSLDSLAKFMVLTLKEATDKGIKAKMDYGRLAFFFTRILENEAYLDEFKKDVLISFYDAKREEEKEQENKEVDKQ